MDIKSKKFNKFKKKTKTYYSSTKITSLCIIFICAIINYFTTISAFKIVNDWDIKILQSDSFFETEEFQRTLKQALDTVICNTIYYGSEERIIKGEFIDEEEMLDGFKEYYNIIDYFTRDEMQLISNGNLMPEDEVPSSLKDTYENIKYLIEKKLPVYRSTYVKKQLDIYSKNNLFIQELKNFYYYIETIDGKFVDGNVSLSDIEDLERSITLSGDYIEENFSKIPFVYYNKHTEDGDYIIRVGIKEPLYNQGVFYSLSQEYNIAKSHLPFLLFTILLTIVCILYASFYIIFTAGQTDSSSPIKYIYIDKIYNDVQFVIYFAICSVFIYLFETISLQILYYTDVFWNNLFIILLCLTFLAFTVTTLTYLTSVSRQIKGGIYTKNSYLYHLFYKLEYINNHKTFKQQFFAKVGLYSILNGILFHYTLNFSSEALIELCIVSLVALLFTNYLFFMWVNTLIHSIQVIMSATKQASIGNLDEHLDLSDISISFLKFAEDLISIQDNYKVTIEEAVKSEELKTELIANVSHDLRTPLTSIISYIDILNDLENDEESAKKYIKVVHDKAHRLNQLIEDLIEASKVSSGTLTMMPLPMNFRRLCSQCIGELDELVENFNVEVVLNSASEVMVYADGRHLARVVENIVSNAIKYSIENTRVYMDIYRDGDKGVLTVKNTTELDINFTKEQLVARFFRGDEARSTEGTGLGLSIAESLTVLQNGEFDIKTEGDLFKVIISMPLWVEEIT